MGGQSSNGAGGSGSRTPRQSIDPPSGGPALTDSNQHGSAEVSLRESEERYRTLFENLSEGFFLAEIICDDSGKPVDYRYLDVNAAFEALTGHARDEVIGKTVRELLPGAEDIWIDTYGRVALTGKPERIEHFALPLGRTYSTTAYSPVRGQFACLFQDVTLSRQAEANIQRYQNTLSELVERAPFGIYVVDSDLRIAQMNAASQTGAFRNVRPVIGRDLAEALGVLWSHSVAAEIVAHFRQTLDTGEPYCSPHFINPRHDVSVVEAYEWELHRITLPDGQHGVVCYYFDSTKVREAEAALVASEERFRTIAETLPQLVYEVAVDGSRSYFNRRWSEYTGQDPNSLVERSESVHPEDRPRFLATWAQAVHQAAPFECRYRLRRYDGEYRWFLSRAFPVCASAGRPLRWFGTATDVHDLTASQEALREEEALLRAIIDTIAEPVYVKDAQSRLILVNAATLELLGKTREELLGHTDRDFYPDAAVGQAILEHDGQVMTSGTVQTFEETVVTPNGLRIMLNTKAPRRDASGRIVGLVGVARDITELKRAEEERARISREIDEQRGRLQTIVDSLPVGLWITDHMGRMLVINDQARAIWGGEAPAAHTIQDYAVYRVWEGDSDQPLAAQDMPLARALRGEVCRDMILDFQRFNGSRGTQLVAASPVKAPDGRISGAVAVFQDITERRRMEAALVEADRHKNEFLAMLSHELRNPLAPIVNSLYILDHAAPDGEQASRAKQVIGRQVAQLSNLVNDLLDVTRIVRNKIRLQKERLELNELVGRAVEDNRSLFEAADVRLELALARCRVPIVADRTRVAQVVGNLLQNAAKFTPKGGCTRVSVSVDGFTAVLCVADDGVGMAPETLATLFVPFTQADRTLDRSKGGLGLGLALVKALVEMHEGAVSAHSDGLGKGTAFEVRLPLDLRTTVDTAAIQGRATGLRRRILIIEDNLDAADSLREALELSGHEVVIANDGPDGLAKARRHKPDAVFCDIGLPGMDGFAVARTLRADQGLKKTFLVALSGYALPEDMHRSLEAGFQHHLAKPPSLDKLEQLLASLPPRVVGD